MTKFVSLESLSKKLHNAKLESNKIVHCHGVFDLLHIGHIKYFNEAKSFGDILVVTITPDRFVNKGPGRPRFNGKLRAEAIAALDVVDYVAINNWPTAIKTIKMLKPNKYVKGPDYKDYKQDFTGNILLEEDAVKSIGGEIVFTKDITFSSSSIINEQFSILNENQKNYIKKLKDIYNINDIIGYIDKINNLKVLLVGEIIIDEYVFCDTIGKSGKEPVLVNKKIDTEKYPGGVLAAANHVSGFCDKAKILSYIGDKQDQLQFIKDNLNSNIELDFVVKPQSPTILKTRFIDRYTKTKTLGVYDLNDELLNGQAEKDLCKKLRKSVEKFDLIIVVDYGHGLITPNVLNILKEKSKFIAVNAQVNSFNIGFHTLTKYNNVDFLCINESELRFHYRSKKDSLPELVKKLLKQLSPHFFIMTQGKGGSISIIENKIVSCPAFSPRVLDRVGAGDTLLAITSLCFATGIPLDLTLFIGNLAASETVASIGTGKKIKKNNLLKSIESLLK